MSFKLLIIVCTTEGTTSTIAEFDKNMEVDIAIEKLARECALMGSAGCINTVKLY